MPREAKRRKRLCDEEKVREAGLDHTLEESFPASDPPSSIPNPCDPDALEEIEKKPARRDDEE